MYTFFDLETGGLSENKDAIVSAAFVSTDEELNIISSHYSLYQDPAKRVKEDALQVNKLTAEMISVAPDIVSLDTTASSFLNYADVVIAHNIAFDLRFLFANCPHLSSSVKLKTLDTMHLSWDIMPYSKAKLGVVCQRVGIDASGAHNAYDDVIMVIKLLKWMIENKHVSTPLPVYPVVTNYYQKKAFGYNQMRLKGLIS
jgi:DNA polymerase III alpha subunit (gram-positive type)